MSLSSAQSSPSTRPSQTIRPSSSAATGPAQQSAAAARLMSETAHDLRAPLSSVRETMRRLRDGDQGPVNDRQQQSLTAALDQCYCIDQMIGEMVQLERLRSGIPRVNRRWVTVAQIQQAVDQAIRPWTAPHHIELLWDLNDLEQTSVFVDPAMLRRLLVNLITHAIRMTNDAGTLLIRLESQRGGETIRWSVIDQGGGISQRELVDLAKPQMALASGEGLGLSICRQLAALHFCSLRIRSRLGSGTEASFETPVAGPNAVAQCWARWRVAQRGPLQKPNSRHATAVVDQDQSATSDLQHMRLDPPSVTVDLCHQASKPRCEDRLALTVVSVGAAVGRTAADAFDELLQSQLQMFDFVYRVDTRLWVCVFDTDLHGVDDRIEAITDAATAGIAGVRMVWGKTQMVPIDQRRTHARLSDVLVREALSASASVRVADSNQVRLGTAPIAPSATATDRLDAELKRLSGSLRKQTQSLREQAQKIRLK